MSLLTAPAVDRERLARRAEQEGLSEALAELEKLAERIAGGEALEAYELQEIAKRLQSGG